MSQPFCFYLVITHSYEICCATCDATLILICVSVPNYNYNQLPNCDSKPNNSRLDFLWGEEGTSLLILQGNLGRLVHTLTHDKIALER